MSMKILLEEVIEDCSKEMKKLEVGTEGYKMTGDVLAKLQHEYIEYEKLKLEDRERAEQREIETQLELEKMKADRKDKRMNYVLTAAGILVPVGATIWGALKSWKFEETGTVTSSAGRSFMNALLRFKK